MSNLAKPADERWEFRVRQRDIDEAARLIPAVEAGLEPASQAEITRWLGTLGTLVAGAMPAEEARTRLRAYVPLLDAPRIAITRESLIQAGRAFTWFPSFAELQKLLDAIAGPDRLRLYQLRRVAAMRPTAKPAPTTPLTPERIAEIDAMVASVVASAAALGGGRRRSWKDAQPPAPTTAEKRRYLSILRDGAMLQHESHHDAAPQAQAAQG